jgi:hypothetical protein
VIHEHFFKENLDLEKAKKKLHLLQEIDYGDEEILGQDFNLFADIVEFFFEFKEKYTKLGDFLTKMSPETAKEMEYEKCLNNIEMAFDKIQDFKSLCEKISKKNETLIKKIQHILDNGVVKFNEVNFR